MHPDRGIAFCPSAASPSSRRSPALGLPRCSPTTPSLLGPGSLVTQAYAQNVQRPVGFADIVEKVKPAVISVRVKMEASSESMAFNFGEDNPLRGSPFEDFFRRFAQPQPGPGGRSDQPGPPRQRRQYATGQGSGFFISADGYAVTNNHVVDKAESVEVTTDDGKTYTAKVIGTDPRTDIALIKVSGRSDFPFVHFGDQSPRIGDWVIAVGNPFGLGGTVTAGIVSARGRDIGAGPYDDFIQIDAAVNKGNSGGPTFDVDGNVIGVNTAIFSPSGGNVGHRLRHSGRNRQGGGGAAARSRRGHPRLDRRADPAGHRRHRRQPGHEECPRRAGGGAAVRQPGGQGRHQGRRRHRLGQWRGRQ